MNLKWMIQPTYEVLYDATPGATAPNKVIIWNTGTCEIWLDREMSWRPVDPQGLTGDERRALLLLECKLQ